MKREFVIFFKFSKVSMTKIIKNMVTIFFRRRDAEKAYKVVLDLNTNVGGKGFPHGTKQFSDTSWLSYNST